MELKQILARQPGPEVAEQLQIYQQTLKDKTKQMKGMASELNMYETQVAEYKMEIDRLAREMQEVKKKYFMQKKKEQAVRCVRLLYFKDNIRTYVQYIQYVVLCYHHCVHTILSFSSPNSCRDREKALAQSLMPPIVPAQKDDMPRFTGGGFNLKQTHKAPA